MTRFISVLSGKGGVGKTTTAINVGTALANAGIDSLLVDGNLTAPNIGLYLGSALPPYTLHDIIEGKSTFDDALLHHTSGLKAIPGSIKTEIIDRLNLSRLKGAFNNLKGSCETVIIDTGAGFGSEQMAVMSLSNEAIIVTNPEMGALTEALKTIKKAEEQNITVLGIVLNRICPEKNEVSIENAEAILGKPILAAVPESILIKDAQAKKFPAVYLAPYSLEAREFSRIAETLK